MYDKTRRGIPMKIKIHTSLVDNMPKDEVEIMLKASKDCTILNKIIENIQCISEQMDTIIGMQNNSISIIPVQDVIYFFSKEQHNYCKTEKGEFRLKKKMYELEENLDKKQFIRISNSCIANVKYIKNFDLSKIGSIVVRFMDDTTSLVSKRRISYVMKFLKERGN